MLYSDCCLSQYWAKTRLYLALCLCCCCSHLLSCLLYTRCKSCLQCIPTFVQCTCFSPLIDYTAHFWIFFSFGKFLLRLLSIAVSLNKFSINFLKDLFIFGERGREREREGERQWCARETSVGCLSHIPNWEPGVHPRHVPQQGIELATFQFAGWHSSHWDTPARANKFLWRV